MRWSQHPKNSLLECVSGKKVRETFSQIFYGDKSNQLSIEQLMMQCHRTHRKCFEKIAKQYDFIRPNYFFSKQWQSNCAIILREVNWQLTIFHYETNFFVNTASTILRFPPKTNRAVLAQFNFRQEEEEKTPQSHPTKCWHLKSCAQEEPKISSATFNFIRKFRVWFIGENLV